MKGLKVALFLLGLFLIAIPCSSGISPACIEVHKEGGAPDVLLSPECHNYVQNHHSAQYDRNMNCQFATNQGRRRYQEDRIACNLDMQIPIQENNEIKLGIAAVFDGHIGKEASEMASEVFLDFFYVHTVFAHEERSSCKGIDPQESSKDFGSCKSVENDETEKLEILKEALTRTILDIDSLFSKKAFGSHLPAGSTAVVALLVDGQILVANVGDSKAFLCTKKVHSHHKTEGDGTYLAAVELTSDHNPGRYDERIRIEAAGGFVVNVDGPWLNGRLPMSRAIGDVGLKRFGLIAVPELTGWLHLETNDTYLVVSSDGIFESLTPQDTCDLLWDAEVHQTRTSSSGSKLSSPSPCASSSTSLAECIIKTAYNRGSTDNLSVIVVPLRLI